MNAAPSAIKIHRILLTLDGSCDDTDCLTIAVELAARLEVDLAGLFVEDLNLLRCAALPFVHQVSPLTATPHPFDQEEAERVLRRFASRVERQLAAAAEQRRVKWSFQVVRGLVGQVVTSASEENDLVAIAETAPRALARSSAGRAIRHAARDAGRAMLLLRPGVKTEGPIVAIYDGSPGADQALDVAMKLLVGIDAALEVFLVGESVERAMKLTQQVRERTAGHGTPIRIHRFPSADLDVLLRSLQGLNAGLLLMPADSAVLAGHSVDALARGVPCPVLLLR